MLIIGRILQGISGGITIPLMNIIILEQVPFKNTATIMGIATLVIVLGPALGPAFGGMIVGIARLAHDLRLHAAAAHHRRALRLHLHPPVASAGKKRRSIF